MTPGLGTSGLSNPSPDTPDLVTPNLGTPSLGTTPALGRGLDSCLGLNDLRIEISKSVYSLIPIKHTVLLRVLFRIFLKCSY